MSRRSIGDDYYSQDISKRVKNGEIDILLIEDCLVAAIAI